MHMKLRRVKGQRCLTPAVFHTGVQLEDTGRSHSYVRTGTYNICAMMLLENEANPLHDCPRPQGLPHGTGW